MSPFIFSKALCSTSFAYANAFPHEPNTYIHRQTYKNDERKERILIIFCYHLPFGLLLYFSIFLKYSGQRIFSVFQMAIFKIPPNTITVCIWMMMVFVVDVILQFHFMLIPFFHKTQFFFWCLVPKWLVLLFLALVSHKLALCLIWISMNVPIKSYILICWICYCYCCCCIWYSIRSKLKRKKKGKTPMESF